MAEEIWYRQPTQFITPNNFTVFFPSSDMSLAERLNSLMRLSLYSTIVISIVINKYAVLYINIIIAALTVGIYETYKKEDANRKEVFLRKNNSEYRRTGEKCRLPTKENPFMNVLINELVEDPERPRACNVEDDYIQGSVDKIFQTSLHRDVDDVFGRNASSRQFYTTASTTIPNDQDGFANWLYKTGQTCKEGNGVQCYSQLYRHVTV
jgi:hypothetical protein